MYICMWVYVFVYNKLARWVIWKQHIQYRIVTVALGLHMIYMCVYIHTYIIEYVYVHICMYRYKFINVF